MARAHSRHISPSTRDDTDGVAQVAIANWRSSHDAEFCECLDRAHSFANGLGDAFFAAGFLQGGVEDVGFGALRDDANAVQVAENDIAGLDAHAVDLDRNAI